MSAFVHLVVVMYDTDEYSGAADRWAIPQALAEYDIDVTHEDEDEFGLGVPVRTVIVSTNVDDATLQALRDEWDLDPDDSEPNLGFLGDIGDGGPGWYDDERHSFGGMDFNVGGWSPVLDVTLSIIDRNVSTETEGS